MCFLHLLCSDCHKCAKAVDGGRIFFVCILGSAGAGIFSGCFGHTCSVLEFSEIQEKAWMNTVEDCGES